MWRSVTNFFAHVASRDPRGWHPLLAVYYLTYACDFRCPYCSDGHGTPYHRLPPAFLPAPQVLTLLRTVRRFTDHLVLTGGEPLQHPTVDEVLEDLAGVGFDSVVLTTNGYLLDRHLTAIQRSVDHLVVSLDTLDHAAADRSYSVGPGALARILGNLERAAALPGRRYQLGVSAVATPHNLEDLHAVADLCRERGLMLAVCPQLEGVHPHPGLVDHPAYRALFDRLIADRRRGGRIHGSVAYLEHLRDLAEFRCRPSTVLAISPLGDVFYPCLEIGEAAGNLLATPDLHALRRHARQQLGPEPSCDNRCHSACALGFALLLDRPAVLIDEVLARIRAVRSPLGRVS